MDERNEYAGVTEGDDQIVAGDRTHSLPEPRQLAQRVRHEGQLRPPPYVIDLSIVHVDDVPSAGARIGRP